MAKFPVFLTPKAVSQYKVQPLKYMPVDTSMFKYLAASTIRKPKTTNAKDDKPEPKGRIGAVHQFSALERQYKGVMQDQFNTYGFKNDRYKQAESNLNRLYSADILNAVETEQQDLVRYTTATKENADAFNLSTLLGAINYGSPIQTHAQVIDDMNEATSYSLPPLTLPNGTQSYGVNIIGNMPKPVAGFDRNTIQYSQTDDYLDFSEAVDKAYSASKTTTVQQDTEPTIAFLDGQKAYDVFQTQKTKVLTNFDQLSDAQRQLNSMFGINLVPKTDKNGNIIKENGQMQMEISFEPRTISSFLENTATRGLLQNFMKNIVGKDGGIGRFTDSKGELLPDDKQLTYIDNDGVLKLNESKLVTAFQEYAKQHIFTHRGKFETSQRIQDNQYSIRNSSDVNTAGSTQEIFSKQGQLVQRLSVLQDIDEPGAYFVNGFNPETMQRIEGLAEALGINIDLYGRSSDNAKDFNYNIFEFVDDKQNRIQTIGMKVNRNNNTENQQELDRFFNDLTDPNGKFEKLFFEKIGGVANEKEKNRLITYYQNAHDELVKLVSSYGANNKEIEQRVTIYKANELDNAYMQENVNRIQLTGTMLKGLKPQIKTNNYIGNVYTKAPVEVSPGSFLNADIFGNLKFESFNYVDKIGNNPMPTNTLQVDIGDDSRVFLIDPSAKIEGVDIKKDRNGVYRFSRAKKDKDFILNDQEYNDAIAKALDPKKGIVVAEPSYTQVDANTKMIPNFTSEVADLMNVRADNQAAGGNYSAYQTIQGAPTINMTGKMSESDYNDWLEKNKNVKIFGLDVSFNNEDTKDFANIYKEFRSAFLSSGDMPLISKDQSTITPAVAPGLQKAEYEYSIRDAKKGMRDKYNDLMSSNATPQFKRKVDAVFSAIENYIDDNKDFIDKKDVSFLDVDPETYNNFSNDYLFDQTRYKNITTPERVFADEVPMVLPNKNGGYRINPIVKRFLNIQDIENEDGSIEKKMSVSLPYTSVFQDQENIYGKILHEQNGRRSLQPAYDIDPKSELGLQIATGMKLQTPTPSVNSAGSNPGAVISGPK